MIKDLDYEKLKKSLCFLVKRYVPAQLVTLETHPIRVLERMEKERMATARRGVMVAIADMIEATEDLSAAQLRAADIEMQKGGVYTLSFLRSKLTRHRSK